MAFDLTRALPYLSRAISPDDTGPLHAFGSKDGPIVRTFSETLAINYMIDEPGARVFVRERDVETERREDLHRRALENLRGHVAKRKLRFEPTKEHTWIAKLDGQHDPSLLLLDELWDPPTRVLDPDGEILAALPERNVVMFAGSGVGMRALRAAVERSAGAALTTELFVRRGREWQTLATR